MAIVYKGRRRKFVEREHPRNPHTGEFVEKTGGHASWLMRIADRTQGPNLVGGAVRARAGFGPTGTGRVAASSLSKGDHAKVVGVDASGRPMTLNGYVQAASGVNVRQRGRKTPMIAVQMAETPSGGGANWRSTVYVDPGARVQKTMPKAPSRDALAVANLSDERIEDELAKAGREMDALGSNQGATVRRMEVQQRLTALRQERSRRQGALQARISADIARQRGEADSLADEMKRVTKHTQHLTAEQRADRAASHRLTPGQKRTVVEEFYSHPDFPDRGFSSRREAALAAMRKRGEVDTPRVKQDDGGMAPTTSAAAPAGTMKIGKRDMTADQVIAYAKTKPAQFLADYAKGKYPNVRSGSNRLTRDNLETAAARIKDGTWTPDQAATQLEGWAKLQTTLGRTPYMFAATALRGNLRPKAGAPEAPKTHAEKIQDSIGAYHSSFAGTVTPPGTKAANKVANAVDVLKTTNDRDEARRALDGLTVAQLKQVFTGVDRNAPSGRKADLIDKLVNSTVGARSTAVILSDPNNLGRPRVLRTDASVNDVAAKATFTPLRDKDPNSREGMAASMRQLPGAALRGTAAELEAGDITPREAADRLSQFRRSLAGRTMSEVDQRAVSDLETRLRAADRASLGLDRPAPTPPATAYASITKRATLLSMLRQRGLRAKRGAPDDDLRALLVLDDDRKRGVQGPGPVSVRESTDDARTIEQLAGMKRAALLAVRRNTPGARTLRRGASEREIAEEIVRARNAVAEAAGARPGREVPAITMVNAPDARPGKKRNVPNLPDGYEVRDTGKSTVEDKPKYDVYGPDGTVVGTVERYERRYASKRQGNVALAWKETKGWRYTPKGALYSRDSTEDSSIGHAIRRHVSLANDQADREAMRSAVLNDPLRLRPPSTPDQPDLSRGAVRLGDADLSRLAPTVSTPAPSVPAAMSPLRLDSQIDAAERLIAQTRDALEVEQGRRGTGGMLTDREIGLDAQLKATERKLRELRAEKAKRVGASPVAAPEAPAGPGNLPPALPWRPRDMSTIEARRNAVRDATMFRTEFDALPEDRKQAILTELRQVVASGDTQTIPSNRTSMGTTIRGAEAPHVMKARGLLNNFLTVRAAAPDNSIAGRAARLKAGDGGAISGATIEQMQEIAREAGFWGPGNWKRPKVEKFILDQVRMGDRRPANLSAPEMARAMRGATKTQALAILEVREATESGLTKTDMKVIARELGVPLRNGDNYTMRNALAAAAKDAPGKA